MQLDLSDYKVDVVNITATAMPDASLNARVYSLENKLLFENTQKLLIAANALTPGFKLELAPYLSSGMVLVKLTLSDSIGKAISNNLYWLGARDSSYRQLNKLPAALLAASAISTRDGDEIRIQVELGNRGTSAALANKLILENASDGTRILPAYLSDNYSRSCPAKIVPSRSITRRKQQRDRPDSRSGDGTCLPWQSRFRLTKAWSPILLAHRPRLPCRSGFRIFAFEEGGFRARKTNCIAAGSDCCLSVRRSGAEPLVGELRSHANWTIRGPCRHRYRPAPRTVQYDPSAQSYTITGSGENMWFSADAFQFVWKKVSGDVSLAADIAFPGTRGIRIAKPC